MTLRQTWRWFGPKDICSVDDMLQAGVEGVVTPLHHVPVGAVWTPEEIAKRQREMAPAGRLAVGPRLGGGRERAAVRGHQEADRRLARAYRRLPRSLATSRGAGIEVVCYNFMPVLDWTRTDLAWRLPHGGTAHALRLADFAAFDIHILKRHGAAEDYSEARRARRPRRASPRWTTSAQTAPRRQPRLRPARRRRQPDARRRPRRISPQYEKMPPETLRQHLIDFLAEVVPTAEELGIRICCHPDDPPFPLLGLPRVMSTEADYAAVLAAVDSPANGVTFCTGSLGARPDNDLPAMMRRARPTGCTSSTCATSSARATDVRGSFFEAEHLGGDTDMVAVIAEIIAEERRRRAAGRADASIPFRPDHGQDILDDLKRKAQPGYPAIGRLKGLAELRGIMTALTHPVHGLPA